METINIVVRHWYNRNEETIVCAYKNYEDALRRCETENDFATKNFTGDEGYFAYVATRNCY